VLWALGMPLESLEQHARRVLSPGEQAKAEAVISQRIETRRPAAYLTHEAWLQNVDFYVDERVIVPRSYIAELLADVESEGTLDAWLSDETRTVLDLCTGSACLAVIAALAYPEVEVDAADVSAQALEVARINVDRHSMASRITLIESNLFEAVRGPYDLILCNPPYVNSESMEALPAEFRAEPAMALQGGADGMDLVRPLLRDAARHMSGDAVLVLEIGHERSHFERAFPRLEVAWLETSGGADQALLITRDSLQRWGQR
jgi:ribosomal protein L3 glutamine methyltransferase